MLLRILSIFLIIFHFLTASCGTSHAPSDGVDVSQELRTTLEYIRENASSPDDTSGIGEWTLISLRAGGISDSTLNAYYLDGIKHRVQSEVPGKTPAGTLDEYKPTENARVVLSLSAIGAPSSDIGGYDLSAPLRNVDWVCSGTVNGPVFALLALNASGLNDSDVKNRLADYILECQLSDGGWAISGKNSDPDTTAMALQALRVCSERSDVTSAVQHAIDVLARLQQENGGYCSYGRENSQSVSQVIMALCSWGIDFREDSRFVKNERTLLDVLMEYRASDGGFVDVMGKDKASRMATEQAALALAAIEGFTEDGTVPYSFGK